MRREIKRNKTVKLSISLGPQLEGWLREKATENEVQNLSAVIRELLMPIYNEQLKARENRSKYGQNGHDKKD